VNCSLKDLPLDHLPLDLVIEPSRTLVVSARSINATNIIFDIFNGHVDLLEVLVVACHFSAPFRAECDRT